MRAIACTAEGFQMHTSRAHSTTQLASLASTADHYDRLAKHARHEEVKQRYVAANMHIQTYTRLGKFSTHTHTLTETQKHVLQERPSSSDLFFQLNLLSYAQKVTVTSVAVKQQT